jgi:hypothetical protein
MKEVAYTPPGNYPPYINITRATDGIVRVTVRADATFNDLGWPSNAVATIDLPIDEAQALFGGAVEVAS